MRTDQYNPPYTAATVAPPGRSVDTLYQPRTQADYTAQKRWLAWAKEQLLQADDVLDADAPAEVYDELAAAVAGHNAQIGARRQAIMDTWERDDTAARAAFINGRLDADTAARTRDVAAQKRATALASLPKPVDVDDVVASLLGGVVADSKQAHEGHWRRYAAAWMRARRPDAGQGE